jgi:hypothetical protein
VVQYKLLHNEQMAAADFDQQVLDWFLQIIVWLGKVDKEMEQDHVNSLTPTLKNSSMHRCRLITAQSSSIPYSMSSILMMR